MGKSHDKSEIDVHSSALLLHDLMKQAVDTITPIGEKHGENLQKIFFFFLLFRPTPVLYGSSQTRGRIGAVADGLHCSHSNTR